MSESEVRVEMRFDGESQHGSYWQHLWHRWRWWIVVRAFGCMAAVALGSVLLIGGKQNVLGAFLVSVGSLGFVRPMIWQMWQERGLRKHPAYNGRVSYIFSASGVEMDGQAGKANVAWNSFTEVVAVKKGLLIYQDQKQYIWIPRKAFAEGEVESVIGLSESAH